MKQLFKLVSNIILVLDPLEQESEKKCETLHKAILYRRRK